MRIAIFGTGYVGLVTGTCFAEMGNQVTCIDTDAAKVARLRQGEVPIYEPGLEELVADNVAGHRLAFETDAEIAVTTADACFICVGTPMGSDGQADLTAVAAVARRIGACLRDFTVVVTKSTVPVGTADQVRGWVSEGLAGRPVPFAVAANPEFLKEGSAVEDFMKPDRVVIGIDDPRAETVLRDIYAPFIRNGLRLYSMDIRSAEMTKYAANCMLATKISFINEMAAVCEALGADVRQVRLGVGSDARIGLQFLHPGVGYGGSCFPKDVKALIHTATAAGCAPRILQAVEAVNQDQKQLTLRKLTAWCRLHDRRLADLTVAVWGLTFKPNTDDVRESPAIALITALVAAGARVRAHDPKGAANFQATVGALPGVSYHDDPYEAADADVLCLLTEWRPYRRPDFTRLAASLRGRSIFDGRNQYDERRLAPLGLTLYPIGASPSRG
jgi:UDPglucose 6-dehydrogenase